MTRLVSAVADLLLIVAGTALLCAGASLIHPAGPWLVAGAVFLGAGIAVLLSNVKGGRR